MRKKLISIVAPCYNEEKTINAFYEETNKMAKTLEEKYDFEFVLCNDGSKDKTEDLILDLNKRDKRVKLISLSRNYGQEIAILGALEHSKGDAVAVFDVDLQDPLTLMYDFLDKWENGWEVVNATRTTRQGETFMKKFTSDMFYRFYDWILPKRIKCPRNTGHCRLLDRKVVDAFLENREQLRFFRGAVPYIGFKTTEVFFERHPRVAGETKYNYKSLIRYALDGIVGYTNKPLYIPFVFAFICFGLCVYFTLMLNLICACLMGVSFGIFVCLGIIGEYLGQTYNESKRRSLYHCRMVVGYEE